MTRGPVLALITAFFIWAYIEAGKEAVYSCGLEPPLYMKVGLVVAAIVAWIYVWNLPMPVDPRKKIPEEDHEDLPDRDYYASVRHM